MSNINLPRIKQIRQKNNNGDYAPGIPIGSEGKYIDISSNLDLEEELKLGGNHHADISYKGKNSYIVEYYYAHNPNNFWKNDQNIITVQNKNLIVAQVQQGQQVETIAEFIPHKWEEDDSNLLYTVRTDIIEELIGDPFGAEIDGQEANLIIDTNSNEQIYDYQGQIEPYITSVLYRNESPQIQKQLHTKDIHITQNETGDHIDEQLDKEGEEG